MTTESKIIVWAADVGSIGQGRFGWCRIDQSDQTDVRTGQDKDVHAFVAEIAADLSGGHRVALGFECPLFIPVMSNPNLLNKGRPGEGNRPWSAGAGSGALATGLPICVWVFEQLKQMVSVEIKPTFDWDDLVADRASLFIWEAFVSAKAKAEDGTHHGDARVAAQSFCTSPNIIEANAVVVENPYSLVGAALLRSGLSTDLSLLSQACVVIKS